MQYVNLLGFWNGAKGLDAFARKFFAVVGVSQFEVRESSNYVDGRYFKGKINDITYTISLSDLTGNVDLPFWVQVKCDTPDLVALVLAVDEMIRNKAMRAGFQFARMLNYGKLDEQRVDYCGGI